MWSLYLAIGAGSIPVLFLINDDDDSKLTSYVLLYRWYCTDTVNLDQIRQD